MFVKMCLILLCGCSEAARKARNNNICKEIKKLQKTTAPMVAKSAMTRTIKNLIAEIVKESFIAETEGS